MPREGLVVEGGVDLGRSFLAEWQVMMAGDKVAGRVEDQPRAPEMIQVIEDESGRRTVRIARATAPTSTTVKTDDQGRGRRGRWIGSLTDRAIWGHRSKFVNGHRGTYPGCDVLVVPAEVGASRQDQFSAFVATDQVLSIAVRVSSFGTGRRRGKAVVVTIAAIVEPPLVLS